MGIINVLVHGLFFMRVSENNSDLELVVPPLSRPHHFVGGVRGQLAILPNNATWIGIGLNGKPIANAAEVPKSILRFNLGTTGLGTFDRQKFAGTLTLPWPLAFFSIRCDVFDTSFLYDRTGTTNIADDIARNCRANSSSKISFISCLQYSYTSGINLPGWTPGINLHCYNEACNKESIDEVNQDFSDAGAVFTNSKGFDLRMAQAAGSVVTPRGKPCPTLPGGLNIDDDYSLPEDPLRMAQGICKDVIVRNVSPANCPNFFVGP